jgi:hypothetical protein
MRLPDIEHTSRPWRIHEVTRDFRLEDVWALPTPGGPDDLARLVRFFAAGDTSTSPSRAARALFAIRWKVGALLGWDDPGLGPGLMAKYEHELRALEDTGLDDVAMDAALTFLLSFIQASERGAADARAAARQSAMDDQQWWAANAPLLARVFDERRYPTAARVGSAAGAAQQGAFNPASAFSFGLERVIDGLAALINRDETSR